MVQTVAGIPLSPVPAGSTAAYGLQRALVGDKSGLLAVFKYYRHGAARSPDADLDDPSQSGAWMPHEHADLEAERQLDRLSVPVQ
jgi:hypothetical protein